MSEEPKQLEIKIDTGNIAAVMQRMAQIEHENKLLTEEKAEREKQDALTKQAELQKLRESKESGKGCLPANLGQENNEGMKEFDNFPSMVEYYREHDPEIYKKLLEKGLRAFHDHPQSFEYRDDWKDGTSCIHKALMKQNAHVRKKP